jgi:hypothetical protein
MVNGRRIIMLRYGKFMGIVFALALIFTSSSWAIDSLVVDIDRGNLISNPRNPADTRFLLQFNMPEVLDTNCYVTYAMLKFDLNIDAEGNQPMSFYIHPLSRSWDVENVGWGSPWNREGGDFQDTLRAMGSLRIGDVPELNIDITHFLQCMIRRDIPNHGFIIRQYERTLRQFTVRPRNDNNSLGQLVIYYVRLEPEG